MVMRSARQIEDENSGADEWRWPQHDLEALGACPVCDGSHRRVLFSGLRDLAFAAAPGEWTMWRCACGVAYLDPRPTLSSIGAAYSRYYTHAPGHQNGRPQGTNIIRRVVADLKNDYLNRTFGYRLPAMPLGAALVRRTSSSRRALEHSIRHLPAPSSKAMRLLDAGCGNGEFLESRCPAWLYIGRARSGSQGGGSGTARRPRYSPGNFARERAGTRLVRPRDLEGCSRAPARAGAGPPGGLVTAETFWAGLDITTKSRSRWACRVWTLLARP